MEPGSWIGYLASLLTTISFVPQVVKVVLEGKTRDISRNMYVVLSVGVGLWLAYGIIREDLPIILANAFTLIFTTTILYFKLKEKEES
ncbi:sugar efflux transporter for intercellular exchange [Leptospira broomii serovar Hurstbridge str. 5399]|uniref:Sugar efflux transporter for intercellular exchange n=1 Tax=Leptospira broomii serovar Hurstbridge str. 5399 TaxID=1049789 RepID=T0F6B7_9LEPT|nr:SemiSWEET transporter [Leptospira broomii]EQA43466.1 sugar efflux transporter for intercellular exchange [Leptospira broomii serovar Hurstbridge str. 5399]